MVPHILFHGDDSTYFPNASVWRAEPTRRSSGITEPLVAASVVRRLFECTLDLAIRSRLTALLPKLLTGHRWCYSARDPYGTGMVSIIHPWESGMDNSPLWDDALSAVDPGPSVAHLRKDTGFAAADERPTAPEYDRYINLVIRFRDNGYRADRLYDISPFRVADIGFNAILQRANRDLRFLARGHWRCCRRGGSRDNGTKDRGRYRRMLARQPRCRLRCRPAARLCLQAKMAQNLNSHGA